MFFYTLAGKVFTFLMAKVFKLNKKKKKVIYLNLKWTPTKCGGFFLRLRNWMHEISQFSVNWPQTCSPVLYYRPPGSTLGRQWKQLIITSPTPPQKLISLLPQYYHMIWAGSDCGSQATDFVGNNTRLFAPATFSLSSGVS